MHLVQGRSNLGWYPQVLWAYWHSYTLYFQLRHCCYPHVSLPSSCLTEASTEQAQSLCPVMQTPPYGHIPDTKLQKEAWKTWSPFLWVVNLLWWMKTSLQPTELKRNLYFNNYRMGSAVTRNYFQRNSYSPDVFKATFVELATQCPSWRAKLNLSAYY